MAINKELMKKICRENIPLTKEEYETMSKDMTEEEKEKVFEWAVDSDGNFKYHYVIEPDDNELDTAILFKMYKEQTKYLKSIKKMLKFFTVLTILGIIAGVILVLMQLD